MDGDGSNGYTKSVILKDFQNIYSQQQRGFIVVCGQHLSGFTHKKTLPKKVVTSSASQEFFKIKVPSLWGFFYMHTGCL